MYKYILFIIIRKLKFILLDVNAENLIAKSYIVNVFKVELNVEKIVFVENAITKETLLYLSKIHQALAVV